MAVGAIAVITRLSMMFTLLPGIGELSIPVRVRMALVFAVSAAIVPLAVPVQMELLSTTDLLRIMIFEGLIGFALGFSFRVLVQALMMAGTIIAQAMSLSQIFGAGVVEEPNPSVAMLLIMAGAALFVTLDFHTYAVGLLMESYMLFPIGDVPASGALGEWAMQRVAGAVSLSVSLAAPFLIIGFLYNVVLGLMNQAMPQMMVTFIGVPANVMVGLLILGIAIIAIMLAWVDAVEIAFEGFW